MYNHLWWPLRANKFEKANIEFLRFIEANKKFEINREVIWKTDSERRKVKENLQTFKKQFTKRTKTNVIRNNKRKTGKINDGNENEETISDSPYEPSEEEEDEESSKRKKGVKTRSSKRNSSKNKRVIRDIDIDFDLTETPNSLPRLTLDCGNLEQKVKFIIVFYLHKYFFDLCIYIDFTKNSL